MENNSKDYDLEHPDYEAEYERNCHKICELSMENDKLKRYIFTLLEMLAKELNELK